MGHKPESQVMLSIRCFAVVFLFCTIHILMPVTLRAGDDCKLSVSEIRYELLAFRFETVVAHANACLKHGKLSPEDKKQAYELLALAYLELKDYDSFRNTLQPLLLLDPDFELIPVEPNPEGEEILRQVRRQLAVEPRTTSRRKSRWKLVAIGAGVLAGTTAVLILTGSGADDGGFPEPPGRPGGQ